MRISGWALALAGLAPMFAAWPQAATPYVLPKLFLLALAAAAASFGALFSHEAPSKPKAKAPVKPDILRPLAFCLGAAVLSSVFSSAPAVSLLGEYSARGHGLLTLGLCAVVAALASSAGPAFARIALLAAAWSGAALSAYGLLQLAGLDPVVNAVGGISYGRIGSLSGSPVGLGASLAMLLPLQLRLALDGESPRLRLGGWACAAFGGAGLLFTWSRGAWLAAVAGAACYLLWTGRMRAWRAGAALAAAGVLALALAGGRARPRTCPTWDASPSGAPR